jgi:hypothetical protein
MSAPAARGPLAFLLKSQTGQWFTIVLGGVYAFPEQAKAIVFPALKEAANYSDVAKQLSQGMGVPVHEKSAERLGAQAVPIIIHTGGSSDKGYMGTIAYYAIGAGACWVGFVVLTNALPEAVQEVMPVTRKFFSKTSHILADGILQVRKIMEEKIAVLSKKQDDMDKKIDDTHASVRDVKAELGETRSDIGKLGDSMERCEETLMSSKRLQSYTSKGVTLLVRCVASMLPTNDRSVNELAQYIRDGEEMGRREQQQQRLSDLKGPGSIIATQPEPKINYMIRDSECDSSLASLEDVQSILGIGPGMLKA